MEKVRNRQADLHARADEKKKNDWVSEFNAAWEKLGPTRAEPAPQPRHVNGAKRAAQPLAWNSKQVLQAKVRRLSPVGRKQAQEPVVVASPEALQKFNRLWESLIPGAHGIPSANGIAGANGIASANGIPAANGIAGANGTRGANGIPSANGLPGADGANIAAPQPEPEGPPAWRSLPRSLSLVPVQATETLEGMERMGAWGRAVLLLRSFAGI
jgi:hypothetical protein